MAKYLTVFTACMFMLIFRCHAQTECLQFSFEMLLNNVCVSDIKIKRNDLDKVKFQLTYYNCDNKTIFVDSLPLINFLYVGEYFFDRLGDYLIGIRAFPIWQHNLALNEYYIYEKVTKDDSLYNSLAKFRLHPILPNEQYTTTGNLTAKYLSKLDTGEYEISLDYLSRNNGEIKKPSSLKTKKDSILNKYFAGDSILSNGAFFQISRNSVKFEVVK